MSPLEYLVAGAAFAYSWWLWVHDCQAVVRAWRWPRRVTPENPLHLRGESDTTLCGRMYWPGIRLTDDLRADRSRICYDCGRVSLERRAATCPAPVLTRTLPTLPHDAVLQPDCDACEWDLTTVMKGLRLVRIYYTRTRPCPRHKAPAPVTIARTLPTGQVATPPLPASTEFRPSCAACDWEEMRMGDGLSTWVRVRPCQRHSELGCTPRG